MATVVQMTTLAMNGAQASTTTFTNNGKTITETTSVGSTVTVLNDDGSITETYPDGKVFNTVTNADGSITKTEVVTP